MKLHSIIVALVAASGFGVAAAQEATPDTWLNSASTATRAEVRAQAAAALRAGEIQYGEATRFVDRNPGPGLSRAQVVAEARAAQRLGALSHGETNLVFTPTQLEQIRLAGERAVGGEPMAGLR